MKKFENPMINVKMFNKEIATSASAPVAEVATTAAIDALKGVGVTVENILTITLK